MQEKTTEKQKSAIEKAAPLILIVFIAIIGYMVFVKVTTKGTDSGSLNSQTNSVPQVDIDFINSEKFNNLNFVPEPSVFEEVEGDVPAGREDPFAPVQ